MRHNLAPEFPRRRPTPPLTIPPGALVMTLALIVLVGLVVWLASWPLRW